MTSHDDMRKALDAATPGPWRVYDSAVVDSQYNTVARGPLTGSSPAPGALDDAHLIANAPAWLAQLLDECAAKDAEIERLTSIANINATTIDVEQTYGHCLATGEPEDIVSMEDAIRVVRSRLDSLGWDCSPDDDPLSADYCPVCSQGSNWRH